MDMKTEKYREWTIYFMKLRRKVSFQIYNKEHKLVYENCEFYIKKNALSSAKEDIDKFIKEGL